MKQLAPDLATLTVISLSPANPSLPPSLHSSLSVERVQPFVGRELRLRRGDGARAGAAARVRLPAEGLHGRRQHGRDAGAELRAARRDQAGVQVREQRHGAIRFKNTDVDRGRIGYVF